MQVVQRVAVLGEDDELALPAAGIAHLGVVLQDPRKLVPFAILAGGDHGLGLFFQALEDDDFGFQFRDGLGGGGLIDQGLFEVLLLLGVKSSSSSGTSTSRFRRGSGVAALMPSFSSSRRRFQPFLAALQRLEDGLGAGGQAALQGGQGEADRALARCPSSWSALPISVCTYSVTAS